MDEKIIDNVHVEDLPKVLKNLQNEGYEFFVVNFIDDENVCVRTEEV